MIGVGGGRLFRLVFLHEKENCTFDTFVFGSLYRCWVTQRINPKWTLDR